MRVIWHDASDSSARCAKCTMAGTRPQRLYGSSAEAVTKVAALAPQDEPPGKWASQFRTDGPPRGYHRTEFAARQVALACEGSR